MVLTATKKGEFQPKIALNYVVRYYLMFLTLPEPPIDWSISGFPL